MNPINGPYLNYQNLRVSVEDNIDRVREKEKYNPFIFVGKIEFLMWGFIFGFLGFDRMADECFRLAGGKIRALSEQLHQFDRLHTPLGKVSDAHLVKILQETDEEGTKSLLAKMDFHQSTLAKKTIGDRKFYALIESNPDASATSQVWKDLIALRTGDLEESRKILKAWDKKALLKSKELNEAAFEEISKINRLGQRLLIARELYFPENLNPKEELDLEKTSQNLHIEGTSVTLPFTKALQKTSSVLKDSMQYENEKVSSISPEKKPIFEKTVKFLSGEGTLLEDEVGPALACMHQYFDKFADEIIPKIYKEELPKLARKEKNLAAYLPKIELPRG